MSNILIAQGEGLDDGMEWLTLRMKNNASRPAREIS